MVQVKRATDGQGLLGVLAVQHQPDLPMADICHRAALNCNARIQRAGWCEQEPLVRA